MEVSAIVLQFGGFFRTKVDDMIWFFLKLRAVFKTTAIVLIWIPATNNFTILTKRGGKSSSLVEKTSSEYSIPSQFTTNCWTHPMAINNIRCPGTSGEKTGNCAGWATLTGVHSVVQEHIAPFPMPHRRVQVWHFITLALICADESPTQSDQHILLATWILRTGDTITMSLMMVRHFPHHHCLLHHLRPQHQYGKSLHLSHSCHDDVGLNPLEALKVSGNFLPFPIDSLMNKC